MQHSTLRSSLYCFAIGQNRALSNPTRPITPDRISVKVRAVQEELVDGNASLKEMKRMLEVIPAEQAREIIDPAAQDSLRQIESVRLRFGDYEVDSTFLGPDESSPNKPEVPPVVLLHGFDSSCLAYYRTKPQLDKLVETWAIDLLGDGYCSSPLEGRSGSSLGPEERREHLYAFWKAKIKRPICLAGVSLGGAAAVDFALAYPEAVEKLVLIAPQVMQDGIGPMSSMPRPLAKLGVKLLQSNWLRTLAEKQLYYETNRFATADSVNLGRLHTFLPGWEDTRIAFMQSGGYRVSKLVSQIKQPTTVVWGAEDKVLPAKGAQAFTKLLPSAKLVILERCGHGLHLERPDAVAQTIFAAASSRSNTV